MTDLLKCSVGEVQSEVVRKDDVIDGEDGWWVVRLGRTPWSWSCASVIPEEVATLVAEELVVQREESTPVLWVDASALAVAFRC